MGSGGVGTNELVVRQREQKIKWRAPHHFPRHPGAMPLPWLVAHHARFRVLPTTQAAPRGQRRCLPCVLARRVEMAHELSVAPPKRGLDGAQGKVGEESRPPWQACPYLWRCPSWRRVMAKGEDVIVLALEATQTLLPGGRSPLRDVYHRPEKRRAQREEKVLHGRHVPGFGRLRNRASWKAGHWKVLGYRLPS